MEKKIIILLCLVALTAPLFVHVASAATDPQTITSAPPSYWPIVPCGLKAQPLDSNKVEISKTVWDYTQDCNQCLLILLFKNLIDLVVKGLVPILGTFFFLLGGFLILLGADKPGRIADGKKIMWNTAIGIVIILCSYIITAFILKSLAGDTSPLATQWDTISCKVSTLKEITEATLPSVGGPGPGTQKFSCKNNQCTADTAGTFSDGSCGGTCQPAPVGQCGDMNQVCQKSSCPAIVKDVGLPSGKNDWTYLIPEVAAQHSIPGADTVKFLKALMAIESNGKLNAQSNSSPPSCGLMQFNPDTAKRFVGQCGVSHPISCEWLKGKSLQSGETLETVAKASICMAAEYSKSMIQSSCYKGQLRDVAAGYNGGGGCDASKTTDNALALSKSCSSASTATVKNETDCSGRPTVRYECVYEDYAHTSCNAGFKETRDYAQKFNACYY